MKTILLLIGKTTDARMAALQAEYEKRIARYTPFESVVLPTAQGGRGTSKAADKAAITRHKSLEAKQILSYITPADHVVLLDERGMQPDSIALARWIEAGRMRITSRLVIIIGGPYGFAEDIYARANEKLSLSNMTFSHQMVRLIFTEQFYRACTIINGEHYHHE